MSYISSNWLSRKLRSLMEKLVTKSVESVTHGIVLATAVIIEILNKVQPGYEYTIGYNFRMLMQIAYCHRVDKVIAIDVEDYNIVAAGMDYEYPTGERTCGNHVLFQENYLELDVTRHKTDYDSCLPDTGTDTYRDPISEYNAGTHLALYAPDAFGGLMGTGGIDGTCFIQWGGEDQSPAQQVADAVALDRGQSVNVNDLPAYRGMFSILYTGRDPVAGGEVNDGIVLGYQTTAIKPLVPAATRNTTSYSEQMTALGTPERATDFMVPSTFDYPTRNGSATCDDLNPAHIILDCLLLSDWGGLGFELSMDPSTDISGDIDEPSFYSAAATLFGEEFGLSFLWKAQESVDDFILRVLAHINGLMFINPLNGLFTLKLLRDIDNSQIVLDESNIISLENFEIKATTENINKLTVQYTDYAAPDDVGAITLDSLGSIRNQGSSALAEQQDIQHITRDFWGVSTPNLAAIIGARELRAVSSPLSMLTILVNRTAYDLLPGSLFTFSWTPLGIVNMDMRVTQIDMSGDGSVIRIDAVTDVFGLTNATIVESPTSEWVDPANVTPTDIPLEFFNAREVSYVEALNKVPAFDSTKSYIAHSCLKTSAYYTGYRYLDKLSTAGAYVNSTPLQFTTLYAVALDELVVQGAVTVIPTTEQVPNQLSSLLTANIPVLGVLGTELVRLSSINNDTRLEITVIRGCVDTVPEEHVAGTYIYFFSSMEDKGNFTSSLELDVGETINYKFLPKTATRELAEVDATEHSIVATNKLELPYPPAHVLINGDLYPDRSPFLSIYNQVQLALDISESTTHTFPVDGSGNPISTNTINVRCIVPKEEIDFVGDNAIILTFAGIADYTITEAFIGDSDTTVNPYDFASSPTRITFSGANSVGSTLEALSFDTDVVEYGLDGLSDVLISLTIQADETDILELVLESEDTEFYKGTTYRMESGSAADVLVPANGYIETAGLCLIKSIRIGDITTAPYTRISWSHRDRVLQESNVVGQDEVDSYGPEVGTTYTIRLYNADTTDLLRTITNITEKYYDYLSTDELSDNGGAVVARLLVELETVRSGITSLQHHSIFVNRGGFGLDFDENFGG